MSTEPSKLTFHGGWEYEPAPESTDHVSIEEQYALFIGGEFVEPKDAGYFDTINPATEQSLAQVAMATDTDVDHAVKAARKAYDCLLYTSPSPRDATLSRMPGSA